MIPRAIAFLCPLEMLTTAGAADTSAVAPTVVVSLDGAASASATNAAVQVAGTHAWTVLLTIAEMTADLVTVIATRTGDVPCVRHIHTENIYTSTKAGFIDASILSRLADADYTEPDNTAIGTIAGGIVTLLADGATSSDVTTGIQAVVDAIAALSDPTGAFQIIIDDLAEVYAISVAAETEVQAAARYALLAAALGTLQDTASAIDAASPAELTAAQVAIIAALPSEPPTAEEVSDAVIAALIIHVSIPAATPDGADSIIPVIRNVSYTGTRGIRVTVSILPADAVDYRLTIRRRGSEKRYLTTEIVPVGTEFAIEFEAPDTIGAYTWDIEPRDAGGLYLPTLAKGTLLVVDDVTRPTDWVIEE